jgi:hypothetical protein
MGRVPETARKSESAVHRFQRVYSINLPKAESVALIEPQISLALQSFGEIQRRRDWVGGRDRD